jgi:hypothetical protein
MKKRKSNLTKAHEWNEKWNERNSMDKSQWTIQSQIEWKSMNVLKWTKVSERKSMHKKISKSERKFEVNESQWTIKK